MSFSAELESTARALVATGKRLFAADESFPTIEKRFQALDSPSTEENGGTWRGSATKAAPAQAALFHRAKCNHLAVQGKYSSDLESVVR